MKVWVALLLSGSLLAFACSSSGDDEGDETAAPDGGSDVQVVPEAGSVDASDASPPDAGLPKAPQVTCESSPCYLAVSGNAGHHLCGLLADGAVRCWGRDSMEAPQPVDDGGVMLGDGALGRGRAVSAVEGATPAPVVGLSNVTQISVGPNFGTCARTSDGSVYCWGKNDYGQLGRPPSEPSLSVPTRVEGIPPVDEVQLGFMTGCAIASADRALYCWGDTHGGFLDGLGVDAGGTTSYAPQIASNVPAPVRALAIGNVEEADTIIAHLDGNVLASIGYNALLTTTSLGQVGLPLPTPVLVPGVVRIWPFAHLTTDAVLKQWGAIDYGSLYLPSWSSVVDLKLSRRQVFSGGALLATGRLFRWGDNSAGAAGVPPEDSPSIPYPVEVHGLGKPVASFATALRSTCAVLVDGEVKCWGANAFGELGRRTVDLEPHPLAEGIR
ncbi:MAG: repeat domain protein [Labilithrix sp.]|nr:repeat domain protein [Labilithrix sp.]